MIFVWGLVGKIQIQSGLEHTVLVHTQCILLGLRRRELRGVADIHAISFENVKTRSVYLQGLE